MGQIRQRNVLADAWAKRNAGGVGAAALAVDQGLAGRRVHHRQVAQRVAGHASAVDVVAHGQRTQVSRLVFTLPKSKVRGFAMEVSSLDFGAGQIAFHKVVFG